MTNEVQMPVEERMNDDYRWVEAADEQVLELLAHVLRKKEEVVASFGPGIGGRWLALMGPRRDPTPPHDHELSGYQAKPDHPIRCTDPRCWTRTAIGVDGKLAHLDPEDDDYPARVAKVAAEWR